MLRCWDAGALTLGTAKDKLLHVSKLAASFAAGRGRTCFTDAIVDAPALLDVVECAHARYVLLLVVLSVLPKHVLDLASARTFVVASWRRRVR